MRKLLFINYIGILLLVACAFVLVFVSIILWWPLLVVGLWFTFTKRGFRKERIVIIDEAGAHIDNRKVYEEQKKELESTA